jgi:Tfp pilus assembly protein PilF
LSEPDNRLALINIATAYWLSKDFPTAEHHFEAAIEIESNDPIHLAKLAWSEFEQGKKAEGRSHLETAKNCFQTTRRFDSLSKNI